MIVDDAPISFPADSSLRADSSFSRLLDGTRLPALDGIRAVAVAMVMANHGGLPFASGELGVTIFFVLSGFLITWLLLQERAATGRISVRGFYLRRALRIFPAYLVFVAVSIALDSFRGALWDRTSVLTALTYTINYQNAYLAHPSPIPHAWSLAVEEQFYLLWPLALIALGTTTRLRVGLIGIIVGVSAWRSLIFLRLGVSIGYVYNAFETRFDSLAIGCLLAVLLTSPRVRALAPRLAGAIWAPVPVILLLLLSTTGFGERWHYSLGLTVDSLLIAVVILQLMQLSGSAAWGWLDSRPVRWVGRLSYPLYLWHLLGFSTAEGRTDSFRAKLVVGVLLSFGFASISYYGVERYFLGLKERLRPRALAGRPGEP